MGTVTATTLRLGLIGGNITASRSPALHILCGLSVGRNVTYDLLIPAEMRLTFPDLLAHCAVAGFAGVNVTYPHKEEAAARVPAGDPVVTAMETSNTVLFTPQGPRAHNSHYSGFVTAFRARFGGRQPGPKTSVGFPSPRFPRRTCTNLPPCANCWNCRRWHRRLRPGMWRGKAMSSPPTTNSAGLNSA
jgi:hypothetical protein